MLCLSILMKITWNYCCDKNWSVRVQSHLSCVVLSCIIRAIDEGHVVTLALLDLSSAFDTVDHPTLLSILQSRFSVTWQPLDWFRSYLTGRTQVSPLIPVIPFLYLSSLECLKALVLAQPNLSRTRSVPPLPFPYTQFNTTCLLMILSPTVTVKFLKLHY